MNMRILLPTLGLGALLLAACGQPDVVVNSDTGQTSQTAGISVSGTGLVTGKPDTLTLSLGVSSLRPSVQQAVADSAALTDRLIASLKASGVAEKDIQTTNYSIYPEYNYTNNAQTIIGYRVTNQVEAKLRDLPKAGATIDAATAEGGNDVTVNGVSFSLEANQQLLVAAREQAWNDAEGKANQLASLAGVELGRPTSIAETVSAPPVPVPFETRLAADTVSTPIQPGEAAVTVTIQVVFGIPTA